MRWNNPSVYEGLISCIPSFLWIVLLLLFELLVQIERCLRPTVEDISSVCKRQSFTPVCASEQSGFGLISSLKQYLNIFRSKDDQIAPVRKLVFTLLFFRNRTFPEWVVVRPGSCLATIYCRLICLCVCIVYIINYFYMENRKKRRKVG